MSSTSTKSNVNFQLHKGYISLQKGPFVAIIKLYVSQTQIGCLKNGAHKSALIY